MSSLLADISSESEEESEDNSKETLPLSRSSRVEVGQYAEVGALLSQVSDLLQTATRGPPEQRVQKLKWRLKEICPKFTGSMINFELPRDATRQLLRELPEISPDFGKVSFKAQKDLPPRTSEDMIESDKTMVEISKKLAGAITYLVSTVFPKSQKGHLKKNESIFRAIVLTAGALNQLQVERHADPVIRRVLATTTETEDIPDSVLEMRKNMFFPVGAGGAEPSSQVQDCFDLPVEKRPPFPLYFRQMAEDRDRQRRERSPMGDRSISRTPPRQRAERERQWRFEGIDARRKMFPPTDKQWGGPSPSGRGRRRY
jgi:hypothetical protein